MDLPGAKTGKGDGTAVTAPGRWLLVLVKKKTMATLVLASFPCFFLFSSLLFPSFSVLLSFFFFFSFHSNE
jgi:hypothetical protein